MIIPLFFIGHWYSSLFFQTVYPIIWFLDKLKIIKLKSSD